MSFSGDKIKWLHLCYMNGMLQLILSWLYRGVNPRLTLRLQYLDYN